MTGKYVFTVDPKSCRYVFKKDGTPMLRFSCSYGFVEDGGKNRKFVEHATGCLGSIDRETQEFNWTHALNRMGPWWKLTVTPTKEIKDGVIAALNDLGVLKPFKTFWDNEEVINIANRKKESMDAVYTLDATGSFVTE